MKTLSPRARLAHSRLDTEPTRGALPRSPLLRKRALELTSPRTRALIGALRDRDPVSPQGVARVLHLLGDGSGPLYGDEGGKRASDVIGDRRPASRPRGER